MPASSKEPAPSAAPNRLSRRNFIKASAASVSAPFILGSPNSRAEIPPVVIPPSPPTTPWVQELPTAITPLASLNSLSPPPSEGPNTLAGECGRWDHERWAELYNAPEFYELRVKENPNWVFNPAYPPQPIWGFDSDGTGATTPGPTFFARYGRPILCRFHNELPQNHVGFGSPEISIHLHNLHCPSDSDGFPGDYFSPNKSGPALSGPGKL